MSMVMKHYGSILNNFAHNKNEGESFQDLNTSDLAGDKSIQYVSEQDASMHILNDGSANRAAEAYPDHFQGEKFDLGGFSEYFPFGLRQVFQAATSLNQMLA